MPIFGGTEQDDDLGARFERWLRTATEHRDARVLAFASASAASGWSNETYKAVVATSQASAAEELIIRLPPEGEALFRDYDIERQYRTMKALEGIADFPVAPCRWLETSAEALGRPFYVMDLVEGLIPRDKPLYCTAGWVVDATTEQRLTMWRSTIETIANLAVVDWRARGLDRYAWPDRNRTAVEQHLSMWEDLYDWGSSLMPRDEHALAGDVRQWLRSNLPAEEERSFIWGDCRFGNFVYDDFRPVGLLDWEISVEGDNECDFAYFLFCQRHLELLGNGGDRTAPRLSGFLSDEESIGIYERHRGRAMQNFEFYWMFNAFKVYAIRQRIAGLNILWKTMAVEDAMRLRKVPTLEAEVASRLR